MIPDYLSPAAAAEAHFAGPVVHSAHFGAHLQNVLSTIPPQGSPEEAKSIVVIGGGKSAQE